MGTLYAEDYIWPLLGMFVAVVLLTVTTMLREDVVKWPLILTGCILYCSPLLYLCIGLRIIHHKDSVEVVNPFYPVVGKVLASGICLDTLKLAECIEETDYGRYKIKVADIYVLTAKDSTTQIVFRNTEEVIRGRQLKFKDLNTAHGKISVCQFRDEEGVQHVWDLYGQDANAKDYSPHIIEYRDYYDTY